MFMLKITYKPIQCGSLVYTLSRCRDSVGFNCHRSIAEEAIVECPVSGRTGIDCHEAAFVSQEYMNEKMAYQHHAGKSCETSSCFYDVGAGLNGVQPPLVVTCKVMLSMLD